MRGAFLSLLTSQPRLPHHQVQYCWATQDSRDMRRVIGLLLPYLGQRRRTRALELLEAIRSVGIAWGERTHCSNGHPYSGDNLIKRPSKHPGKTFRACRTCSREYNKLKMRAYRARQKVAA